MTYPLKYVALHITNECSGNCPMCYYVQEGQIKCEGNIEILKKIGTKLKKAGVEEVCLVGGDPAEHSKIQELVEHLYNLGIQVSILSNTHNYKNSSIEKIAPYVYSLEGTFHASTPEEHNAFNQTSNSYQNLVQKLKIYNEMKTSTQKIGAVLNVMNYNYNCLYEIIARLVEKGITPDYVMIQRIGLYGKASGNEKYIIIKEMLATAFEQIARINSDLGIESTMVDAFPLCLVPEKYHRYLAKCDWGYGTAAMDMNGDIVRCAVSEHKGENLLGNIFVNSIEEIWENSETLINFRNKKYLHPECLSCDKIEQCGGGCPMSCGNNTLSSDILVRNLKK
ncbi:MAG: radical SAM protein [Bacilli bacterium]|nr:radical SAM protein [Bacilli bacterium]